MKPIPGHAVLFYTTDESLQNAAIGVGPYLATVTQVFSQSCVNLEVQRDIGDLVRVGSVSQDDQLPGPEFAHVRCWMWPSSAAPACADHKVDDEAIATVDGLQAAEGYVLDLMEKVRLNEDLDVDPRWSSIARTHVEQGFMAMNRAILSPETEG